MMARFLNKAPGNEGRRMNMDNFSMPDAILQLDPKYSTGVIRDYLRRSKAPITIEEQEVLSAMLHPPYRSSGDGRLWVDEFMLKK